MGGWGRDVWEDPGAHEPRGGVTWAPETGQTREGAMCMCVSGVGMCGRVG